MNATITYLDEATEITGSIATSRHYTFVVRSAGVSIHIARSIGCVQVYVTDGNGLNASYESLNADTEAAAWEHANKLLAQLLPAAEATAASPIAATKAPLAHDGDSRAFHLADGRSIHLTRNAAADYRVVVLDFQARIADPAYARNFTSEAEARATARGWFCELTGRTPQPAPAPAPASVAVATKPALKITVVDNPKTWASRGKRSKMTSAQRDALTEAALSPTGEIARTKDHTITTLKALVKSGWAEPIEGIYSNCANPTARKTLAGARITRLGRISLAAELAQAGAL